MAKETVTVDNKLEEIELQKNTEMDKKAKKEKKNKTDKKPKKEKAKTKDKGFFSKLATEMKLVTWPTKKNVFKYSFATVVMIVLIALFLIGISALFDLVYALVQGWIG